jgi:hypothetical protein
MPRLNFEKIGTLLGRSLRKTGKLMTTEEIMKHLESGKLIGIEGKRGLKFGVRKSPSKGRIYEILTSGGRKDVPYRRIMWDNRPILPEGKTKARVFGSENEFVKWVNKRSLRSKINEKLKRLTL